MMLLLYSAYADRMFLLLQHRSAEYYAEGAFRHGAKSLLLDDSKDFFFAHDEELFAVQLNFGAGVLAEEELVASLHVEREYFALVVGLALTDGDDFARLGLLFCGVRDNDATTDAFALFDAANQNAVMQRCK